MESNCAGVKIYSALAFLLVIAFLQNGCQKPLNELNSNTPLLDSIVGNNSSIHFIYDGQGRVIEDRYQLVDTLEERNVYEYHADERAPFTKKHFIKSGITPDKIAVYRYNTNGQKIYDSTYEPASGYYTATNISYYGSGKIYLVQAQYTTPLNIFWRADTIYLNSNGNTDSLKCYWSTTQGNPGSWTYWYSTAFTQYNSAANIFKSLSSGNAALNVTAALPWGSFENYYPVVDYFNNNYCTAINTFSPDNATYQKQLQFNSNNLPVTGTVTYTNFTGYSDVKHYRFVYR